MVAGWRLGGRGWRLWRTISRRTVRYGFQMRWCLTWAAQLSLSRSAKLKKSRRNEEDSRQLSLVDRGARQLPLRRDGDADSALHLCNSTSMELRRPAVAARHQSQRSIGKDRVTGPLPLSDQCIPDKAVGRSRDRAVAQRRGYLRRRGAG